MGHSAEDAVDTSRRECQDTLRPSYVYLVRASVFHTSLEVTPTHRKPERVRCMSILRSEAHEWACYSVPTFAVEQGSFLA